MKVILVNGSPKGEGCTYTALSEVAGALKANGIEVEIFHIGAAAIPGCIACLKCREGLGHCVFNDAVDRFAEKAKDADGFIFGSPVYYAGVNGALCAFMDRLFFTYGKSFKGKPAAGIISCRRGGSTAAFDRMNKYFTINQMPIVSSNYWNMVHGSTPADVKKDLEGLQVMRTLGNNMAWLLKCIRAGKEAGIEMPKGEDKIYTNFIRGD